MAIKLEAVLTASDRATAVIKTAQAATIGLNEKALGGLSKLDALSSKIGAGIKTTVATLGVAGLALGGLGAKAIGIGMDFEKTMSGVAAVSGATGEEFKQLKASALEMGSTGAFNATQVAGAFEILAKAGLKTNQVLAATPGLLGAAAADGKGIEETADSVMSAMKALGVGSEHTERFADKMAKAGDSTAASIGSISESIAIAGPVFKQLNVGMDEAIGMIALLQDRGINASSAGTTLAASLSKLASPMGRTKIALKELGIEVADAMGNMKPPATLLKDILKATSKIKGNVGQMAAMTELVGLESQKALLNVVSAAGSGELGDLLDNLSSADGYARSIGAKRLDNFAGDVTLLKNAVDGLATSLFDTQSGPLRDLVQDMTKWVDANKEFVKSGISEKIKEWTPLVKGFGEGVAVSLQKVEPVLKGIGSVLDTFFGEKVEGAQSQAYFLGRNIADAALAFVGFVAVTKAATAATLGFQFITKATRIAVLAWEGAIKLARAAMISYQIWTKAGTAATLAMSGASVIATGNLARQRVAAFGAAGGFKAMAGALGVATVAYLAYAAVDEANEDLKKTTEGLGVLDIAGGMWDQGTWDPFKVVDDHQNRLAKERRKKQDEEEAQQKGALSVAAAPGAMDFGGMGLSASEVAEMQRQQQQLGLLYQGSAPMVSGAPPPVVPPNIPPQQVPSRGEFRDMVKQSLEVTIKAPEGAAEVTKKPSGAKVNVQPSGEPVDWAGHFR